MPSKFGGTEVAGSRFGGVPVEEKPDARKQAFDDLASEVGFFESLGINIGKGLYDVGRGLGIADPADETEKQAMAALQEKRPYTGMAGEVIGESLPFLPLGGIIPSLAKGVAGRVALGTLAGGAEGGIIGKGREEDAFTGSLVGGVAGGGAEVLIPVIGRLGSKIIQRINGRAAASTVLDEFGGPTDELKKALDDSGISFEDLKQDAFSFVSSLKPGADVEQVARKGLFESEGVPLTRGELTKESKQVGKEQQLMSSLEDKVAEPMRQFKLRQSEAIKKSIQKNIGFNPDTEETGGLIKDALVGRRNLLRTEKNALYKKAAERAEDVGGVPVFVDNIKNAVPDADTLEDLAITSPAPMESLNKLLTKYGMLDAAEEGFEPTPLMITNVERFRKSINAIERGDNTGAVSVATSRIKSALDSELDELGNTLKEAGYGKNVFKPLIKARKKVRTLKTEFAPQNIIGRLTAAKKDGVSQVIESSKIYDKVMAKSIPIEDVRKTITSLGKSGKKGEEAIANLQMSTLLDLLDAGFTTESRKVSGVRIFNPTAFKNRMGNIGEKKLSSIFANNRTALANIRNVDRIAKELVPPSDLTPKGSAPIILDLANKMGMAGITAKGGLVVGEVLKKLYAPIKSGVDMKMVLNSEPETIRVLTELDKSYPRLLGSMGIAGLVGEEE